VKAAKIYLADSGLLHTLLGLDTTRELEGHPKVGASWEGFMLGTVVHHLGLRPEQCHFWATHGDAELDLCVRQGRRPIGFEFKRTTALRLTRSMHVALDDLKLDRIDVLHAARVTFPLAPHVRAVAAARVLTDLETVR
jgi:uncharacterized protein